MAPGQMKQNNVLHLWGNEKTMNLNSLILTNIQSSHYFKVNLYELKTYHEVIDEIYYKVEHLEPWEKGSRKTSGQTGMCGGVRGVGAGGIVSTAYCLLYKLFTLKLTRKQVNGLISHSDSPYIRALGFMYIRYTQPPADLWDWYDDYLDDEEEIDPKAGGGSLMTMGQLLRNFLTKLEWYSSLFPRIPVPIQKEIERKLNERKALENTEENQDNSWKESETSRSREQKPKREERSHRVEDRDNWDRHDRHKAKNREYEKSRPRHRSPEYSRHRDLRRNGDVSDQISREKERQRKERERADHRRHRSRSRSKERSTSHRNHKSERKHKSRSRSRDKSYR